MRVHLTQQLDGVDVAVEWRRPNNSTLVSDDRITVGSSMELIEGRLYQRSVTFSPLSAGDSGSYSCSATVMPSMATSGVTNGMGTGSDSLTVDSELMFHVYIEYVFSQSLYLVFQHLL